MHYFQIKAGNLLDVTQKVAPWLALCWGYVVHMCALLRPPTAAPSLIYKLRNSGHWIHSVRKCSISSAAHSRFWFWWLAHRKRWTFSTGKVSILFKKFLVVYIVGTDFSSNERFKFLYLLVFVCTVCNAYIILVNFFNNFINLLKKNLHGDWVELNSFIFNLDNQVQVIFILFILNNSQTMAPHVIWVYVLLFQFNVSKFMPQYYAHQY